jgi:hypothetical protein
MNMKTEAVTQDGLHVDTRNAVKTWLREESGAVEVIPATVVCGWAGISEGALRARQRQGRLPPVYIHVGLRAIQVLQVSDVVDEFFPDGLDEEGQEELELGRGNDSFTFSESGAVWRILHAGLTKPERVRAALMKAAYKHGKGAKRDRDAQEAQEHRTAEIAELKAIVARQPELDAADREAVLWEAIVDRWGYPALVVCDRFRLNELRDTLGQSIPIEPRVTQWSSSSEDIRSLRKHVKDGPFNLVPEAAPLLVTSLGKTRVQSDASGNVRLLKMGHNNAGRDDVAAALTLAAGAFARYPATLSEPSTGPILV